MGEQVRISLTLSTECMNRGLEVPIRDPIAVPADIGRKGLSTVINHLLDRRLPNENDDDNEDEDSNDDDRLPSINFDFMIGKHNKLLRTALEREARRTGLSLEEAIPITYFPAQKAPERKGQSDSLPDWISALSFSSNLLCAGCYDGSMHVFQTKDRHNKSVFQKVAMQGKSHQGPIQCMATMTTTTRDDNYNSSQLWVATGSMDHTLLLHQVDHDTYKTTKVAVKCMDGHAAAISSVDFFPPSKTLASGDWDGGVCIWTNNVVGGGQGEVDDDPAEQQPSNKKFKTGSKKAKEASDAASSSSSSSIRKQSPIISLQAHSSNISGLSWGNYEKKQAALSLSSSSIPETLITGSWDHSLKVWNIERQDCLLTLNGSRVISCLDTSYFSSGIVATGHPDCTVRLWDVRTANTKESALSPVSDNTFRPSHKAWVSAVQWSQHNPYHLASTSHDGTVKLWDIRSSIPLHTVRAFEKTEKGLALVYGDAETGLVYAGGTDCVVKQYQSGESGHENEK